MIHPLNPLKWVTTWGIFLPEQSSRARSFCPSSGRQQQSLGADDPACCSSSRTRRAHRALLSTCRWVISDTEEVNCINLIMSWHKNRNQKHFIDVNIILTWKLSHFRRKNMLEIVIYSKISIYPMLVSSKLLLLLQLTRCKHEKGQSKWHFKQFYLNWITAVQQWQSFQDNNNIK